MDKELIKKPTPEELQKAHNDYMNYLRNNPNNFSYWFPHIQKLDNHGISIPKSIIIPIPEEIYRSFFREKGGDGERVEEWILKTVKPVIEQTAWLKNRKIFIKNGCFSNKFDFANGCLVSDAADTDLLIHNITNIEYLAATFETDGNLELVLREYIEPAPKTPTIYNGMPLRPEIRVFFDFENHNILYVANYWDWDYCHEKICFAWDGSRKPDADVYEQVYPHLKDETERLKQKHLSVIWSALNQVTTLTMPNGRPNIWSVDFMAEEDKVWLIDMAQGWRSVYWKEVINRKK